MKPAPDFFLYCYRGSRQTWLAVMRIEPIAARVGSEVQWRPSNPLQSPEIRG